MNKVRLPKKVTSQEEFVALITERLLAVQKDRDQMKKEVLEMPLLETSSEEVRKDALKDKIAHEFIFYFYSIFSLNSAAIGLV